MGIWPTLPHKFLIVDLEATCEEGQRNFDNEIIEIGAVCIENGIIISEFQEFVNPIENPKLTEFCTTLTNITQEQVESGRRYPEVYQRFSDWCLGNSPFVFCSWGAYDRNQFRKDCTRWGINYSLEKYWRHINLKEEFRNQFHGRSCGVLKALRRLGLEFEGSHHRGIDDARNIARLFLRMNYTGESE